MISVVMLTTLANFKADVFRALANPQNDLLLEECSEQMLRKAVRNGAQPPRATFLLLTMLVCCTGSVLAQDALHERLKQRIKARLTGTRSLANDRALSATAQDVQKLRIAGLNVAVWQPRTYPTQGAPLVVFSHGFHGVNTQSASLMKALASASYLVLSPNHKDAIGSAKGLSKRDEKIRDTAAWSDRTYKDRRDDIVNLLNALHTDPHWRGKIDWSKLVLAGHSLGGYTAMGCAGAWNSWKVPDVKAVLALSPYCQPFAKHETLSQLHVPLMYLSGTRDIGVLPFIKRPGGAFDQANSPTYLVVFNGASHFAFSNLNRDSAQNKLINHYCVAFLNKFVLGDPLAKPGIKLNGISELDIK